MGLSAAAALNQFGSLANHLSGVQPVVLHQIVAHHDGEHGLVLEDGSHGAEERRLYGGTQLEHEVFHLRRLHGNLALGDDVHSVHCLYLGQQILLGALHGLSLELLNLPLHRVVFADEFLNGGLQVLGIVEECLHCLQVVFHHVHQVLTLAARLGLYAADAGSHATLRDNLEEADATRARGMDAAAELAGRAEAHHAHLVAVFLAEQGDGPQLLGLVERHVAVLVNVDILANHVVYHALHLAQLLVADFLEVREVEAQRVGADERTLLLHVVA